MKFVKITFVTLSLIVASSSVFASGIPVVDALANKRADMEFIKKIAHWKAQLDSYRNQIDQLKGQLKAMTGIRNITNPFDEEKLKEKVTKEIEDYLNDVKSAATEKLEEKYLGKDHYCFTIKNTMQQEQCKKERVADIVVLAQMEEVIKVIDDKMKKISVLSEKIKESTDIKEISDLQAAITLEGNSIALLEQQTRNLQMISETKKKIQRRKLKEDYFIEARASLESARNVQASQAETPTIDEFLNQ